ncbi:sensor domain-containing diguanylate cyclase [Kosakonia sp. BK9b]|uniref:sensor domain-containing diguanylate cyclase n=1 Tax=Kosakonia sp. TaxID=1916651 RepID=UPI00289E9F86|nr:sensor domain-containing diguanylate cyclase [Kosakonia sp.]
MNTPAFPADEEKRLASLHDSGILESGATDRLDRLTRLAKRMFNVPGALITLVDEDTLHFKSSAGYPKTTLPRKISFCGHVILCTSPMIIQDTLRDERFADNPLVTGESNIRFYAGHPLRLPDGAIVGSFCLIDNQPRDFSDTELDSLKDFALIVEDEFAVMSAATTDELTGLFNRRGFESLAKFAITGARRRAEPLTLAWIDLNHFKEINDTWGHAEGDEALKSMASVMTASLREADMRVRYGGDEFAIVFSDTDEQGAWIAMQHLVEQVAAWNQTSGKPWKLAFSWGISEFDHNGSGELREWMKDADEKMYAMKQQCHRARRV